MVKTIYVVLVVALLISPSTVLAKPDEPLPDWPKWVTQECLSVIYRIVQHESGSMRDNETFRFMTEQIVYDILRMGCNNLTRWRWAIGDYSIKNVSGQVRLAVIMAVADYPNFKYPKCQFIGYWGDVKVWKAYGYKVSVDIEFTANRMTVIGVNCGKVD